MKTRVLILGGYGVFGGYLSAALAKSPEFDVLVAGRSLEKAEAFCAAQGGTPVAIDRQSVDLAAEVRALQPDIVVDAAGPFQAYDVDAYGLAKAAIHAGSHYIDLSDDAQFTSGIVTLDGPAKSNGVAVVSGASSVPGISSAAVAHLSADMTEVTRIESVILPGNRAPRGLSVIRAILAQAGQKMTVHAGGGPATQLGWSDPRQVDVVDGSLSIGTRWANPIGAPDLALFPNHFNAKTVYFRAGLELRVLHFGLWAMSFLVRWRLLKSLEPLARPVRWIAGLFERFGSDRGAMIVRVLGRNARGDHIDRNWTLIAEQGDGPQIPTFAAQILCRMVVEGQLHAGARPCLGLFSLGDVAKTAESLSITSGITERYVVPVFEDALGCSYGTLPEPIRALHDNLDISTWSGTASVQVGSSRLAGIVRRVIGFPGRGEEIPVSITIQRRGEKEFWTRNFAGKTFRSILTRWGETGEQRITERFGPFVFVIALDANNIALRYPVERGWFLGIPLPKWLLPVSKTTESATQGIFTFDVSIVLPFLGLMVQYSGQLKKV